jgi:hypothetical protein
MVVLWQKREFLQQVFHKWLTFVRHQKLKQMSQEQATRFRVVKLQKSFFRKVYNIELQLQSKIRLLFHCLQWKQVFEQKQYTIEPFWGN